MKAVMRLDNVRSEILALTKKYFHENHEPNMLRPFRDGDRIPYGGRVYGAEELQAGVEAVLDFWLTGGRRCEIFERNLAAYIGVKHCALVNSGSSANLLAFMALTSPLLGNRRVQPGDEVITVAAAFPTTVAPILQAGAVPVFVDVELPSCNIDATLLETALSSKTKAVMLAHTLGNPFNLSAVKSFCDVHGLWLIEDNCDALGSEYTLNGVTAKTGSCGHIATSSFYPPHHITMGEGGAVYTDDALLHQIVVSLRDWGRDCRCVSGQDNLCGHRHDQIYGELPLGYDHKYVYSHLGYNLKATDIQAAIGLKQLERLPDFVEARRKNWNTLRGVLSGLEDCLMLPEPSANANPSWFGFLIVAKQPGLRDTLVRALEDSNIQTRMLFAGNLLRHPCMTGMQDRYRIAGTLENTDSVLNDAFWIGVYPGMKDGMLEAIGKVIINSIMG